MDRIGSKGHKNMNSYSSLNHETTFCPKYKLSKILKYPFIFQHKKYYDLVTLEFCFVMYFLVFTVLRTKHTLSLQAVGEVVSTYGKGYLKIS